LDSALSECCVKRLYSVEMYSVFRNQDTFLLWCLDLKTETIAEYLVSKNYMSHSKKMTNAKCIAF